MRRWLALLVLGLWPLGLAAQSVGGPLDEGVIQSPVLVIEFERVFAESDFGQRIMAEIEAEGAALSQENRRIETELADEERRLTQQRATLAAKDFKALAEAFDEKVQRLRREQDAKARAVSARPDEARRQMAITVQPVLQEVMQEARAAVILERRSVFVAISAIDVTELVTQRINAQIGDGSDLDDPDSAQPTQP
ncbi:OmpH family outer membrane protein [Tropicibacter oceani]|uniref:OmpH family outer membrane protein n=1 Tax=Tropicibacter oceani TaxID=3058420 RepID=A0ABY8QF45_9RHOB|nr:OmpH family outer membrane protein [Tropicibacter oceani]WGW02807.1 OmpH family outer membrane protein [Tropicibacter oceani]